jgi:hypothetical protein
VSTPSVEFVERIPDEGQWFARGTRVEYFRRAAGHLPPGLEKAALGSYEVRGCTRVRTGDRRWLDVTLHPALGM